MLQVGTITPYKNQLESILATAGLLDSGVNAKLTLVGPVTDQAYYRSLHEKINYINTHEFGFPWRHKLFVDFFSGRMVR